MFVLSEYKVEDASSAREGDAGRLVRLSCALAVTALAATAGSSPVLAQSAPSSGVVRQTANAPRSFNIPAQPLASALNAFGRQSGLQVTLSAATSRGITSSAVSGAFTPEQALARLLLNTGITFQITSDRTAIIGEARAANGAVVADGAAELPPVNVIGGRDLATGSGFQGTPDWVYQTPSSVSVVSREAIQSMPNRSARDLLDSVSGVWANRTESQNPGISVNIRGLQDQDRIVTMIDGARQNFQRNAHGTTQRTYVDTAFIRQIDIEKSGTSAVGGAGALGGSVNFRTIEADDIIKPGKKFGTEVTLSTGTNAYNFDGSVSSAVRVTDWLSINGGVSHKKLGEYEIGKNGLEAFYRAAVGSLEKPTFTGAETWSTLLKAEADITSDMKLTLGWLRHQSESSQGNMDEGAAGKGENTQNIINSTYTAAFKWKPANELIDLKARLWYNHLTNDETREANLIHPDTRVDYKFGTIGGSLENTSRFHFASNELALNYGFESFRDDGQTTSQSSAIANNPQLAAGFGGLNPTGKRDVASGFANATLKYNDWLTVSGGARYDWYRMTGTAVWYDKVQQVVCLLTMHDWWIQTFGFDPGGFTPGCFQPGVQDSFPSYQQTVDQSAGALLPTAMVAVKPFDWLQPFVKYSHSFRPPTVMEAFISGGHPGSVGIEFAPNPNIRPEKARTWEVGANISKDGLFIAEDKVRLKAVHFWREVEDYIVVGTFMPAQATKPFNTYLNLDGMTRMNGLEIEANYDAGPFYLGGSFTYLHTDWAKSYTYTGSIQNTDTGDIINSVYVPPKTKLTLDAGARFFERKLTVGARLTDVGAANENFGKLGGYPTRDYTVYDLYGSYAFTDDVKLRVAINNVTDLAYVPALGEFAFPAPGRTMTASLNCKF